MGCVVWDGRVVMEIVLESLVSYEGIVYAVACCGELWPCQEGCDVIPLLPIEVLHMDYLMVKRPIQRYKLCTCTCTVEEAVLD